MHCTDRLVTCPAEPRPSAHGGCRSSQDTESSEDPSGCLARARLCFVFMTLSESTSIGVGAALGTGLECTTPLVELADVAPVAGVSAWVGSWGTAIGESGLSDAVTS